MPNVNNSIKCKVSVCKHCDSSNYCKLNTISIGGEPNCKRCAQTECQDFEARI